MSEVLRLKARIKELEEALYNVNEAVNQLIRTTNFKTRTTSFTALRVLINGYNVCWISKDDDPVSQKKLQKRRRNERGT